GGGHRRHDDRRGDRRGRARRVHLPRRRDGGQPDDFSRSAARGAPRNRRRRGPRHARARAPPAAMRWAALLLVLAGCGGGGERVAVGSKNFTEQRILGELLAQTVESTGLRAERRLDLGGTFVCNAAIRAGQIDAYVEYTGTALTAVLKQPPESDPERVLARVRDAYAAAGLVWTAPLGFDNTFALVVRGEDASIRTISDAVPRARDWRAAFGYEFKERADGY